MTGRRVIERTLHAPLATVWQLWSTPEGFASWYGPRGFDVEIRAFHATAGGALHYTMRAVSTEMAAAMEKRGQPAVREVDAAFTEVEAMVRIGFTEPFGPQSMHTLARFEEQEDRVQLTVEITAPSEEWVRGAAGGWESALSKLEERVRDADRPG